MAVFICTAFGMQAFAWMWLYGVFGVAGVGYWFFDLNDISYYYQMYVVRMAQGLVPYRDFFIEYPPLFALLVAVPGTHGDEFGYMARFAILMMVLMATACVVTALAALDGAGLRRSYLVAAVFSGYTLLLGPIAANRYDAAVALVLAAVALFMARNYWVAVALTIGVGFALKVTPALLLPLVLILAPPKQTMKMVMSFALSATVPFIWVLQMGQDSRLNLTKMFAYHLDRPLEIESVLATPFWIAKLLGMTPVVVGQAAGSQVIISAAADVAASLSIGVLVVAMGAALMLVWRRRHAIAMSTSLQSLAVLAILLASLVASKVLSPQYFVWIIPIVALVAVDRRVLGVLMAAVLLLTHIEFPANYWQFAQMQANGAVSIVIVRNLILLVAFALSLWSLWKIPDVRSAG